MRILLLNGNTTETITRLCAEAATATCSPQTRIISVTASRGPQLIGTRTENAMAIGALLESLATHVAGMDGVIVAVSFDTGLDALREASPVPVVGMTEAALHIAALLGGPIGLIGPGARAQNVYRETIMRSGLADRVIAIEALDMPLSDYLTPEVMIEAILATGRQMVAQGVESIVLAGAALTRLKPAIATELSVPVVEGVAAATVLVEGLVRLAPAKPQAGSLAALPYRNFDGDVGPIAQLFPAAVTSAVSGSGDG